MKQYTTPEQTAKLIELGFKKPENWSEEIVEEISKVITPLGEFEIPLSYNYSAYSIGELLSFLPRCIETPYDTAVLEISYDSDDGEWYCGHRWCYNRGWRRFGDNYQTIDDTELVDALYRYIVALKEEGVI